MLPASPQISLGGFIPYGNIPANEVADGKKEEILESENPGEQVLQLALWLGVEEYRRRSSLRQLLAGVELHSSQRNQLGEKPAAELEHSPTLKQPEEGDQETEVEEGEAVRPRAEFKKRDRLPGEAATGWS